MNTNIWLFSIFEIRSKNHIQKTRFFINLRVGCRLVGRTCVRNGKLWKKIKLPSLQIKSELLVKTDNCYPCANNSNLEKYKILFRITELGRVIMFMTFEQTTFASVDLCKSNQLKAGPGLGFHHFQFHVQLWSTIIVIQ